MVWYAVVNYVSRHVELLKLLWRHKRNKLLRAQAKTELKAFSFNTAVLLQTRYRETRRQMREDEPTPFDGIKNWMLERGWYTFWLT